MNNPYTNQEKLREFFYVIYKRKGLILAFFLATYLGIIAGTWLAPQYYKATTKILIHTNPKQEISLFSDLAKPGERNTRVNLAQDLIQILTGKDMGREIVSSFNLDEMYRQREYDPQNCRDIIWYYIHKLFDLIKLPYTGTKLLLVKIGWLSPEPEENCFFSALQEFLDDWLDVRAERETRAISLSIWGSEPRLASNIANKMAELLVNRTLAITRDQAMIGYKSTASQLKDVEERYLESQEDLKKFREENNIVSLEDQKKIMISRLTRLEAESTEIGADLEGNSRKANEIRSRLNIEKETIRSSTVTGNNPIVMELKSQLKTLQINLNSIILEKREKHPDVLQLNAQIDDIKDKLRREVEKIILSETEDINPVHQNLHQKLIDLEAQILYLGAKKEFLDMTIFRIRDDIALMPQKEIELKKLETSANIYTTLYSTVKDKFEKLLVLKSNKVNEFGLTVITKSNLPEDIPVTWPWWDINTLYLGLPLSIFAAFFIVLFIDYWTDTFSTKKEVEFNLELPVIGLVPDLKRKGAGGYWMISLNKTLAKWTERRS